jgi:hypothetical protein
MTKKEEELERICFNCCHCMPASAEGPTEYGICLNDEEFEPFIEELMDHWNFASCQDLIDSKKFPGDRTACSDFEEVEIIEIDDDSPLGRVFNRLGEPREITLDALEQALLEERIKDIDWKTIPVDRYVKQLKDPRPEERCAAISSLGGLISFGNMEAFNELLDFLRQLPPPSTIEEVHLKKEILRHLERPDTRTRLVPYLIDELYRTDSNNTTRQWIFDILRCLELSPIEDVREPLGRMLEDRRFSSKLKRRIEGVLLR